VLYWSRVVFWDSNLPSSRAQIDPHVVFDGSGPAPPGAVVIWRDGSSTMAQKMEISAPANDACTGAPVIGIGTIEGSTVGSTQDGSASCGGSSDVWYWVQAPEQGTLRVTTCGTNDLPGTDQGIDTVLSLHAGPCPGTVANEHPGACNDDWTSSSAPPCTTDQGLPRDSVVQIPVTAGQYVLIRVARYPSSKNGPFRLNVELAVDGCGRTPQDAMWDGMPLTAQRVPSGNLVLQWGGSCVETDDDYAVYVGSIGRYYDHQPKMCSTGGSTWAEVAPEGWSVYYLVVPRHGDVEGSYGLNSLGSERPRGSPSACTSVRRIRRCP
jgi:hypothetical protein